MTSHDQSLLATRYSPFASSPRAADIVRTARGWIGTPYVHQASVKGAGCDCLGLLRGVWRDLYGRDAEAPPAYTEDWAEAAGRETLCEALTRHMRRIEPASLAQGDVGLFRVVRGGPAKHCGIVARKGDIRTLIHARQNHCVAEEPLAPIWRRRLAFAFRLPSLDC